MSWRLVDSDLSSPPFTAAADEAIALARSENRVPNTLHFYRRDAPTVSLGYFQSAAGDMDLAFCRKNDIQVIRRVSGGSAIYTDSDHLIYGLVVDEKEVPADKNEVYELVCSALVLGLRELGVEAEFKPVNDVLVGGRKISGSAQMRKWGVVLQHGTMILARDREMMAGALRMDHDKMEERGLDRRSYTTSLEEVLGERPAMGEVKNALVRGFEEVFGVRFEKGELTELEKDKIDELVGSKYGRDEWNLKR